MFNSLNDINYQNDIADTDYSDSICSILYAQAYAKARYSINEFII